MVEPDAYNTDFTSIGLLRNHWWYNKRGINPTEALKITTNDIPKSVCNSFHEHWSIATIYEYVEQPLSKYLNENVRISMCMYKSF